MKKDLYEILDNLTPEALDSLPEEVFQSETLDDGTLQRIANTTAEKTGLTLTVAADKCSDRLIPADGTAGDSDSASPVHNNAGRKKTSSKLPWRVVAAAACIALLLGVGVGSYTYAAAKKEYKNALTFFYENDLSTEGLTKNEIKEVYRDFYSHSFTNNLTTDVLLNSRPDVIRGYEITGDDSEWDTTVPDTSISAYKTPVHYEYYSAYNIPEDKSKYNPEESTFIKYRNGEKGWEVTFQGLAINGFYGDTESDTEPVLVYGTSPYTTKVEDETATLIALDADGTILWEVVQNNGSGYDKIDAILANPDGSYTAFGRSGNNNSNYLCINKYTKDGSEIFANTLDIRDHTIEHVTPTESGYLMHLSSYVVVDFSRVLKLDFDGNLVGDFRYESEESDFYIADLCEHNGTVYISGYSTPKAPERIVNYGMRDTFMLRAELSSAVAQGICHTDEELLSLFRNNFTAVLLVCEPDSGTPKEFYSVAGSLGDEVYVAGGSVCWFTKDIIDSSYNSTVKSTSMGTTTTDAKLSALCRFYANVFNTDDTFKEQKKLDLMTELRWGY